MNVNLKTEIWAAALIRRAEIGGAFAAVIRKGDGDAGACLVKVRNRDGMSVLYSPMRNMVGERIWLPKGPDEEVKIDHYLNRRLDDDPDLWIIEIEDRDGRHFITERVDEKL
jgi:hypothetical protein